MRLGLVSSFDLPHHVDLVRGINGTAIKFGVGRLQEIGEFLDDVGCARAIAVCGPNVAANEGLMAALSCALGDRLVGVFDGVVGRKTLSVMSDAVAIALDTRADAIVGVGGGKSLDVARQLSAFLSDQRTIGSYRDAALGGRSTPPIVAQDALPVILVPTTLAGSEISASGSIEVLDAKESASGRAVRVAGRVSPALVMFDPALYVMTPRPALAGSAMNGYSKGIETIYSPRSTPLSDATACHGLSLMTGALPDLLDGSVDVVSEAVAGVLLVQLYRWSGIIHAFGHGITQCVDIQQGIAHAVMAPHVLQYVFKKSDARRSTIAHAMGIDTRGADLGDIADRIIRRVEELRSSLSLPGVWREVGGREPMEFAAIGSLVSNDRHLKNSPVTISRSAASEMMKAAF